MAQDTTFQTQSVLENCKQEMGEKGIGPRPPGNLPCRGRVSHTKQASYPGMNLGFQQDLCHVDSGSVEILETRKLSNSILISISWKKRESSNFRTVVLDWRCGTAPALQI
jgi:hypothetical protein